MSYASMIGGTLKNETVNTNILENKIDEAYHSHFEKTELVGGLVTALSCTRPNLSTLSTEPKFFDVTIYETMPPSERVVSTNEENAYDLTTEFNSFLADNDAKIDDEWEAIELAELFAMSADPDHFSIPTVLCSTSDIPSRELKAPQSTEIEPPTVFRDGKRFEVGLYTWSKRNGVVTKWEITIEDNAVVQAKWKTKETAVGEWIRDAEGYLASPGETRDLIQFEGKQPTSHSVYVNDTFIDIVMNDTSTLTPQSALITFTGFDANTNVNVSAVLFDFPLNGDSSTVAQTLYSSLVTTNSTGGGFLVFTPTATDHTGVGGIRVVQVNDTSKSDSLYNTSSDYFVVEKVYDEITSDSNHTYKAYYFSANFGWDKAKADDFAGDAINGIINAYDVQIRQWNFSSPDPDDTSYIFIGDGEHSNSALFDTTVNAPNDGTATAHIHSGNETLICVGTDLESELRALGVGYESQEDTLSIVIGHEHFHNIQYGIYEWEIGSSGTNDETVTEGTARFSESALSPDMSSYNSTETSLVIDEHNDYVGNTNRGLPSFSYDYALYWGDVYDADGGINTIKDILEKIPSVDSDEVNGISQAIDSILNSVSGGHSSYADSLKNFSEKVFEKEFVWGAYDGTDEVDWGAYLNDVDREQPSYSGDSGTISGSVYPWAIKYVNISNPAFKGTEVVFDGDSSSDFTVKALFKKGGIYTTDMLDLDSNNNASLAIMDSDTYDDISLSIIKINTTGSGDYIVTVNNNTGITLSEGWNLISFRWLPSNNSVSNVLTSISGSYNKIQTYNANNNTWETYDTHAAAYAQTLSTIKKGKAYLIYMNSADELEFSGDLVTPYNMYLYAGWNLIAWPKTDTPVATALGSISGSYDKVQTLDFATGNWETYDTSVPSGYTQTLTNLKTNRGYYIHMNSNNTLAVN